MEVNLSEYCCVCGKKIKGNKIHHVGFRGKQGDIPAFICDSCDYIYALSLPSKYAVIRQCRFKVTHKTWYGSERGYYVCAKPVDVNTEDWQDLDRCWIEVERVYETRWDCPTEPERVRRVA